MRAKALCVVGVFMLVSGLSLSEARAEQAIVTITTSGNTNVNGVFEAFCLSSGTACRVTGNRTTHPGPRSCSMLCQVNEIAVFTCRDNNSSRPVDDVRVPQNSRVITEMGGHKAYGWIVAGTDSANCSYTD